MLNATLTVMFLTKDGFKVSPSLWHCMTFNSCNYWNAAASLHWDQLPPDHVAAFYEGDTCWDT
ncbi:hypothetical protein PHMEG_00032190 [Phytophthora megakarya]|uniref:Uncharacterized protein n=1 Tax=Phytophthora megakarya TaxID=4795 RepID=A0A225UWX1_9STRA|nr:hypothetical protein PHMEG_00032190 [Phytophthora megakarya]